MCEAWHAYGTRLPHQVPSYARMEWTCAITRVDVRFCCDALVDHGYPISGTPWTLLVELDRCNVRGTDIAPVKFQLRAVSRAGARVRAVRDT